MEVKNVAEVKDNLPNPTSSEEEINKAKKLSIKEGFFASLMDGFGNRYISPYAISMGASSMQVGIISSLPSVLGNFSQLISLRLMKKNSRKKIVFRSAFTQSLLWIPIIAIGSLFFIFNLIDAKLAVNLLIFSYSIMIIIGSIGGPLWNSWMKDLVNKNSGEYFGVRNKAINLGVVAAMLLSGLILNFFHKDEAYKGFLIMFFIAFIARNISAFLLRKQYEPNYKYNPQSYFSFVQFAKKMIFNNFGRFVVLVSLVSFATAISGPFFALYMLKDLNLNYFSYTLITLGSVVSIIFSMPFWGKFSDKFGNIKVLRITGFLIPFIPVLYLVTVFLKDINMNLVVVYLICLELFSGFSWAGFNLSSANFIYDAVTREKMAFCVTYFNIINSTGSFIGAFIGGYIISNYDFIFGFKAIFFIFVLSTVLRFLVVLVVSPLIKEVKPVEEFHLQHQIKLKIKIKTKNILKYIGFGSIGREEP